jgi:hypothetical protein
MLPVATSVPTHAYQQVRRVRRRGEAALIRGALGPLAAGVPLGLGVCDWLGSRFWFPQRSASAGRVLPARASRTVSFVLTGGVAVSLCRPRRLAMRRGRRLRIRRDSG